MRMNLKHMLVKGLTVCAPLAIVAALIAPAHVDAAPTKCNSGNPCKLVFLNQPADAVVGTAISTNRFSAGDGIQVQIQFVSGGVATGNAGDRILLTPQPASTNTGTCSPLLSCVTGTDPVAAGSTGTATFVDVALNTHGRYTLRATDMDASSSLVAPATSGGFNIWDNAKGCSGPGLCQEPLGGPHEVGTASNTSGDGILATVLGAYNKSMFLSGTCNSASYVATFPKNFSPAYGPNVGDIELLNSSNPGTKTVSVTYDKTYVHNAGLATSSYNICFESTSPFPDFQNHLSPQEGSSGVYFGLLPGPCGSTSTPFSQANPVGGADGQSPCLVTNPSGARGAVTVTFQMPASDKFCC